MFFPADAFVCEYNFVFVNAFRFGDWFPLVLLVISQFAATYGFAVAPKGFFECFLGRSHCAYWFISVSILLSAIIIGVHHLYGAYTNLRFILFFYGIVVD